MYNYVILATVNLYAKQCQGLNNKIPAEIRGVKIEGGNKWKTLRMLEVLQWDLVSVPSTKVIQQQ
jgi:hypothetical protein